MHDRTFCRFGEWAAESWVKGGYMNDDIGFAYGVCKGSGEGSMLEKGYGYGCSWRDGKGAYDGFGYGFGTGCGTGSCYGIGSSIRADITLGSGDGSYNGYEFSNGIGDGCGSRIGDYEEECIK